MGAGPRRGAGGQPAARIVGLVALMAAGSPAAARVAGVAGLAGVAGAVGVAAVAGVAGVAGVAAQEPASPPSSDGDGRADYDWTLRTLEGEVVSLERYRGWPVFLNVWATWCAPCVAELASIEALASRPEVAGVAFLLVSPEKPEVVDRFRRRLGLSLPVLVEETRMPRAWGLRALPTTWIVDAEGRVLLRHRGAADWDRPEVAALLEALAREAP